MRRKHLAKTIYRKLLLNVFFFFLCFLSSSSSSSSSLLCCFSLSSAVVSVVAVTEQTPSLGTVYRSWVIVVATPSNLYGARCDLIRMPQQEGWYWSGRRLLRRLRRTMQNCTYWPNTTTATHTRPHRRTLSQVKTTGFHPPHLTTHLTHPTNKWIGLTTERPSYELSRIGKPHSFIQNICIAPL